ncbi:hypothetical protein [Propionivibrio sp.]|uniref:hypothetical protein n=1 Tax=Propionivibrio sp. TaxID=2212460 RepID=UPI003BF0434B
MAIATVTLHKLVLDSQDYGSDDEHMVSRVFFDMEIEGKKYADLYADIKQPIGGSFESSALEVSSPANYKGTFNYEAFRAIVERYYRSLVGATGSGIRITGSSNIRMRNNTFVQSVTDQFEVKVSGGPW